MDLVNKLIRDATNELEREDGDHETALYSLVDAAGLLFDQMEWDSETLVTYRRYKLTSLNRRDELETVAFESGELPVYTDEEE